MKKEKQLLVLFLITVFNLAGQENKAITSETTLLNTISVFNKAFKEGDVTKLESMITDNYIHTNGSSKSIGKTMWLAYLKKRKKTIRNGDLVVNAYEMKEMQSELYDNFAIITAKIMTTITKGGTVEENQYRVSHVWVKENNVWKRAAFHDTNITSK
ncbi:nuclear transport factor 2 family protein [Aquimarina longa]|uniref:nuclear transport factor 2 family protein n=1 Tax=Aquimarina longa TaxID=1080221 RepID=UPI00078326AF|nr:nuclear transport factor 2 family protein [Aquimarina longa]